MSVTATSQTYINIPNLYPNEKRKLGGLETFTISALAPASAVLFTNPFDTIKVRMQLEIRKKSNTPTIYKNAMDAMLKIYSNEGIHGLQKGLIPAIFREGSKNLFRLGMYDPIMRLIHDSTTGSSAPGWKRAFAGSVCGVMGAVSCNPFELVKTRLQSASSSSISVGHQHHYKGVWDALRSIIKKEGVIGLYRGSILSMMRSVLGSGANLATYSLVKEYLILKRGWIDNWWLDMVCGLSSGVVSCIFMNPVDVTRTRFYNQTYENGLGSMYTSGVDAFKKIFKNEGPSAFYRGFISHFLRIGPHFCLTFVFLGILRRNISDLYAYMDRKDAFTFYDHDNDGKLTKTDLEFLLKRVFPFLQESTSEVESLLTNYTTRILSRADRNGDSLIEFSEYPLLELELQEILKERLSAHKLLH